MRALLLAVVVAAGLGLAGMSGASAAPADGAALARAAGQATDLTPVAMGCGRGWHRNWRGRCVPNRRWRRY